MWFLGFAFTSGELFKLLLGSLWFCCWFYVFVVYLLTLDVFDCVTVLGYLGIYVYGDLIVLLDLFVLR